MRFYENPFTYHRENRKQKGLGFQISPFYWSFSSAVMAVKGLRENLYGCNLRTSNTKQKKKKKKEEENITLPIKIQFYLHIY